MRRLFWALVGAAVVGGCEAHSCTLMACGSFTEVSLVDEQGEPVRVRGEHRSRESLAQPFDCTTGSVECKQGVLQLFGPNQENAELDLRFQLPDGSFTEWQTVELEVTSKTDPDFNGPGCPCTWYEAAPVTVLVPEAAQLD